MFYKSSYLNGEVNCGLGYDFFFSAFDDCDRTKIVFDKISAVQKIWMNFPHYNLNPHVPCLYSSQFFKEDDFFTELFEQYDIQATSKICVDITGFVRPHLIFFLMKLVHEGLSTIDLIYSEPLHYEKAEETEFSPGFPEDPRIIEGCGSNDSLTDVEKDLLIVTAGYDDHLVAKVSKFKPKIKRKYYILGLPSLQPDMYQESIIKLYQSKDIIGDRRDEYAPAFDPFVTAQVIGNIIKQNPDHNNIYLSPLSTKPHAAGMALYYIWNHNSQPLNIIFPFSKIARAKTAVGLKKTWKYTFQFP